MEDKGTVQFVSHGSVQRLVHTDLQRWLAGQYEPSSQPDRISFLETVFS